MLRVKFGCIVSGFNWSRHYQYEFEHNNVHAYHSLAVASILKKEF